MPTIAQAAQGIVSALWGQAMIRLPDGSMRALQVGDELVLNVRWLPDDERLVLFASMPDDASRQWLAREHPSVRVISATVNGGFAGPNDRAAEAASRRLRFHLSKEVSRPMRGDLVTPCPEDFDEPGRMGVNLGIHEQGDRQPELLGEGLPDHGWYGRETE